MRVGVRAERPDVPPRDPAPPGRARRPACRAGQA